MWRAKMGGDSVATMKPLILAQPAQKRRALFQRAMLGGPFDMCRDLQHLHQIGCVILGSKNQRQRRNPAAADSLSIGQLLPESIPPLRHGTYAGVLTTISDQAFCGLVHAATFFNWRMSSRNSEAGSTLVTRR